MMTRCSVCFFGIAVFPVAQLEIRLCPGMAPAALAVAPVFLARFGSRVSLPFDGVIVACAFAIVMLWSRMYRHYLCLRELFPEALREESREAYVIASLLTSDFLGLFYFSLAVGLHGYNMFWSIRIVPERVILSSLEGTCALTSVIGD
jgi:hypothetical protein